MVFSERKLRTVAQALDLGAFAGKLSTVYGDLSVVQLIQAECQAVSGFMRDQLLRRLASSIQLPECLKAVGRSSASPADGFVPESSPALCLTPAGYLRRLGCFAESELRREFLRCRGLWVSESLEDLDEGNPPEFVKKFTEVYRLHVFDVIMQYRAVFSEETGAPPQQPGSQQQRGWEPSPLSAWAQQRVQDYLEAVRRALPFVRSGASLSALLENCMSCGATLGRIGLDLRPLLPPMFEERVLARFTAEMAAAPELFRAALDQHRWLPSSALAAAAAAAAASNGSEPGTPGGSSSSRLDAAVDSLAPPSSLSEFPPLGVLVNRLLAALNELRHLAPLSLRGSVCSAVSGCLVQAVEHTRRYYGGRSGLAAHEVAGFAAMADSLASSAAPYMIK